MAIQPDTAELLLHCKKRFPGLHDFVMIGRQWLRISTRSSEDLSSRFGINLRDLADPEGTDTIYAEELLKRAGFSTVRSLDHSNYQGAEILQDLNLPLADSLHDCCDCVLDGGSLEHVFDFRTAVENCAAMLRPGGLFITACPVSGWMGHGFYQFSPELFFRVFCPEQGFVPKFAALQVRRGRRSRIYSLSDPARTGHRLQFNPHGRTTMLFVAQRLPGKALPLKFCAQQSDYSVRWQKAGSQEDHVQLEERARPSAVTKVLKLLIPKAVRATITAHLAERKRVQAGRKGLRPCKSLHEAWELWQD